MIYFSAVLSNDAICCFRLAPFFFNCLPINFATTGAMAAAAAVVVAATGSGAAAAPTAAPTARSATRTAGAS